MSDKDVVKGISCFQARSQKIQLGGAFEEKVDLLTLSPEAVED